MLEGYVRQDITAGRGLMLIDPHGELVDGIEEWCALRGLDRIRSIHVLRPGSDRLIPGFNPLGGEAGRDVTTRVDYMVAACAQAWGAKNLGETPRLEKILRALFYVIAHHGLTLAEAPALLLPHDPKGLRRALTDGLPNESMQLVWEQLNALPRREFAEYVESTATRLTKFLASPAMRLIVGQKTRAIDFRAAMDESQVVLVDLSAARSFSHENARTLGGLLVSDLFYSSLGRDLAIARQKPFTLYIDEAYDYLSGSVERLLDQSRKFGLHAVLSHQRIGQLRAQGESVYNAVMGCTQTKIVLGGLSDDDAEIMAREIMRSDINLAVPKPGLTMPVVVGEERVRLRSGNVSNARSRGASRTSSFGTTGGVTTTLGASEDEFGENIRAVASSALSGGWSDSVGEAESHGESSSETSGWSETFRSIREERPVQLYTLEESFHLAMRRIRDLPDRTALVKRRGRPVDEIRTLDIARQLSVPGITRRARERAEHRAVYQSSVAAAEAEIDVRRTALLPARPSESFWQAEDDRDA
ncbi:MAG: type IV secretion system DNA-binding domain-containing protein [Rhizomicrobium sp.]